MRQLILIKHSSPQVDPRISSEKWGLSEEGRQRCGPLAEKVAAHEPAVVVTSVEPKAVETGRIIAEKLGVACETGPGLHEHDRSNVAHMRSADFISMVAAFFRRPDELVLGRETARQAEERFDQAVGEVLAKHDGNVAIVAHGTVIALWMARHCRLKAFQVWLAMGLPSYVVLQLPEFRLTDQVDRMA